MIDQILKALNDELSRIEKVSRLEVGEPELLKRRVFQVFALQNTAGNLVQNGFAASAFYVFLDNCRIVRQQIRSLMKGDFEANA